jgi:hypothetical protein
MAYVVRDIDAAMDRWVAQLKAGPWFVIPELAPAGALYRGATATSTCAIAMGFAGHMCIELIAPLDDEPSVFREHVERIGYGFHHWGVGSLDFDADLARHLEQGHDVAFEATVPTGGRVAYVDTTRELPGFVELVEMDRATDDTFTRFHAASLGWDGSDPVRPFA